MQSQYPDIELPTYADNFTPAAIAHMRSQENAEKRLHPKCEKELRHLESLILKAIEYGDFEIEIVENLREDTKTILEKKGYKIIIKTSSSITGEYYIGAKISWK